MATKFSPLSCTWKTRLLQDKSLEKAVSSLSQIRDGTRILLGSSNKDENEGVVSVQRQLLLHVCNLPADFLELGTWQSFLLFKKKKIKTIFIFF